MFNHVLSKVNNVTLVYMAPVARTTIADTQEHRLVFFLRLRKRLFAPRIPIHWIIRMLQQVWTLFIDQFIRYSFYITHTCPPLKIHYVYYKRK